MSIKEIYMSSGYCDTAVRHLVPLDQIVSHLEKIVGDEITVIQKLDHKEIWMVYDDSRLSQLIYKFPKDYK